MGISHENSGVISKPAVQTPTNVPPPKKPVIQTAAQPQITTERGTKLNIKA